ncbi:topology modulation protein [Bacillus manliponensis]|uniref:Topology modulation protein n=1 Tax=Bacillus manliponensis TaxID=574376 RepID=A0A073JX26_9BACI|nr:topology modulation protein [Bacillus manliponensis]KEK18767.1 topology modulation protein [Bacillus manliponensis]
MKRIMIVGVSSGVGKSTFARKLGKLLQKPVYHLDALFWKPNWIQASLEEFTEAQQRIVTEGEWIIEGNYNNTFDIRTTYADTIIYLQFPLHVCLYRVFERFVMNIGRTRSDLGGGCKEKLDWLFLKFIWTKYYPRKENMPRKLAEFHANNQDKTVILLKNKQEIASYLENIK